MEELGLDYKATALDVQKGTEHKSDWFLRINPNGRIPALGKAAACSVVANLLPPKSGLTRLGYFAVDHADGTQVFESGAIMWYLATKHDKFFPKVTACRHVHMLPSDRNSATGMDLSAVKNPLRPEIRKLSCENVLILTTWRSQFPSIQCIDTGRK